MSFADLAFEPEEGREHLLAWRIPEAVAAYGEAMAKTVDPLEIRFLQHRLAQAHARTFDLELALGLGVAAMFERPGLYDEQTALAAVLSLQDCLVEAPPVPSSWVSGPVTGTLFSAPEGGREPAPLVSGPGDDSSWRERLLVTE